MVESISLDESLVATLREHGFVQRSPTRWEFVAAVETHRWLVFDVVVDPRGLAYTLEAEEWRGGEGFEDEVLRTPSIDQAKRAIARWAAWASEEFVMTTWRRLLNRWGLHFLVGK
ncbi:MAG: hypothetical protein KC486_05760 [Myxococcales bacterium]|nr:hypothetical protein [Myxococcales bacterium]